ncbi:hypothetical protein CBL_03694 [Carabus blaptoides fortunei]
MYSLKGKKLKDQHGHLVKAEKIISESSVIALFFSASWSKHCNEFIPLLKEIYAENVKLDYNITIINVPFDEKKGAMEDHFKTQGDWYTILYGDTVATELQWHYGISYIPNIIVLDPEGNVVSRNGIQDVIQYNKNVLVAWTR